MNEKDLEHLSSRSAEGLTEAILGRTSGRPCGSARERLGDYVDGSLGTDGLDRELVKGHLDGCRECAAVAAALGQLSVDLPEFAEFRPPSALLTDVMAATVGRERRRRKARGTTWADASWDRWTKALLGRSRLAWEAGYVGAVLLWLVFGASWAPLRAAPPQALAVVQENHVGSAVEAITLRFSDSASDADEDGEDVAFWSRVWSRVARSAADENLEQ